MMTWPRMMVAWALATLAVYAHASIASPSTASASLVASFSPWVASAGLPTVDGVPSELRFSDAIVLRRDGVASYNAYVLLGDRALARIDLPRADNLAPTSVHYLHTGVSAGPVLMTDAQGNTSEERLYEPYGAAKYIVGMLI